MGGKIIHDIYQTAHQMFSDMPQGDHKKRAKYRFALQDPDEDPSQLREGRDRGPDREEGHLPRPVRDPRQVHMETRLNLQFGKALSKLRKSIQAEVDLRRDHDNGSLVLQMAPSSCLDYVA